MQGYRDDGVVLRTQKLGEADRIITLLTRHNGRVRAVAVSVPRRVLVGPVRILAGVTGTHVTPARGGRRLVPGPAWSPRSGVPDPVSWSGVVIRGLRWVAGLSTTVVVSSDGSGSIGPGGHRR